ncbi:hypothetical protein AB6A40_006732 [Gnathostoma spinigerum]|uniref:Hexosyltransferase n=1 Tax=Gnathostoma spinigerum TaxID=75299 RepID=A0ABD6ESL9_9BILA
MVYGLRTGIPLAFGLCVGVFLSLILFPSNDVIVTDGDCPSYKTPSIESESGSEHWEVIIKKSSPGVDSNPRPSGKVVRAKYAATELGIREKLLVIIFGQSSLSVTLSHLLFHHVPRLHIFVDASRISADMTTLPHLTPYRSNGQRAHFVILNSIFNLTLHENFDWFFMMPDTTYVNPFELMRFAEHVNWNRRVVVGGHPSSDDERHCSLQSGILLSNPAMQSLIQQRVLCNSVVAESDQTAIEMCIHHATNLSCDSEYQTYKYRWWKVRDNSVEQESGGAGGAAIHDSIKVWSQHSPEFNHSLTVSPLLSEADAHALHEHFIRVELSRVEEEIKNLSHEVDELSDEIVDGPSWPAAVSSYSKPPNRYQVRKWEYFTTTEIFKNEPNQNVRNLSGDDKLDIEEVIATARKSAEGEGGVANGEEFVQLRNGYRLFDAMRGMDYMVDLVYRTLDDQLVTHRVHVARPIAQTKLMNQVPYVKEDTDLTIVVPVGSSDEVTEGKHFLSRYARLCEVSRSENRQTKVVVAIRSVNTSSLRDLYDGLVELRNRCKSSQTETTLLRLKEGSHPIITAAALDEAVDHYGQQMIYLIVSPYADIQREFLDRARINTIKNYQVFFPLPFVEYHPQIVNSEESRQAGRAELDEPERSSRQKDERPLVEKLRDSSYTSLRKPLVVHKDQGHFDSSDFSIFALYGSDYMNVRQKLDEKSVWLDLSSLFLGQSELHVMRVVEPALRIRYHTHFCDPQLADSDYARCLVSRREGLAAKAQLANLLFNHNNKDAKSEEMR